MSDQPSGNERDRVRFPAAMADGSLSEAGEEALCRILTIADAVARAKEVVIDGRMPGLGWLSEETRTACLSVAALPTEEGQGLRPALESLRADFDALSAAIAERFSPEEGGGEAADPRVVGGAYAAAPPPPTTDEEV